MFLLAIKEIKKQFGKNEICHCLDFQIYLAEGPDFGNPFGGMFGDMFGFQNQDTILRGHDIVAPLIVTLEELYRQTAYQLLINLLI